LLSTWLTTAVRDAAPPMWNVRIVSWVPGSPIDWRGDHADRLADVHDRAAAQVGGRSSSRKARSASRR
jgi:hypothetical protein